MKRKLFCLLFTLSLTSVSANELNDIDELKSAIQQGNNINIVTLLNECQSSNSNLRIPVKMTGSYRPSSFMIVRDQISASDLHFTRNDPGYPNRSVFEFLTYKFSANNKMILNVQILDAINYYPLGKEHQVTCSVGSSVKLFSDAPHASVLIEK